MSNQQWNQGQGGEWAPQQPEGAPQQAPQQQDWSQPRPDWNQQQDWTQQGQTSASEWEQPAGQPSAPGNDWTHAQPQPSANDWQQAHPQASAGEWQQAQPQPSAGDWHQAQPQQQAGQEWNQQQWAQQGWDQNQQQWGQPAPQWGQGQVAAGGAYAGTGAPQWAPQPPRKPSPFDFKFDQPALPQAAGAVFLTGAIGLGVWWLFQVINALSFVADYPLDFFASVLGNAGLALFGMMMLRAVLEVAVAIWKKPAPEGPAATDEAEDSTTLT